MSFYILTHNCLCFVEKLVIFLNWKSFVVTSSECPEVDFNALRMSSKTLQNLLSASTTITAVIPNDKATSSMKFFAIISAFIFRPNDEIKIGSNRTQVHQLGSVFLGVDQMARRPYINMRNVKWHVNWPWKIQFDLPRPPYNMCYTVIASFSPFLMSFRKSGPKP